MRILYVNLKKRWNMLNLQLFPLDLLFYLLNPWKALRMV